MHSVTEVVQTDGQTDDMMMPIADQLCSSTIC